MLKEFMPAIWMGLGVLRADIAYYRILTGKGV